MADKVLQAVLSGKQDKNIDFNDFCSLIKRLGFNERSKGDGSHRVINTKGIPERINIQPTSI